MSQRPHMVDGREVDVKRATPKERNDGGGGGYGEQNPKASYYQQCQRASVKKIFIGAIRDGIEEEDLRNYFSSFGNVVDCIIMRDADGRLRGFGFLEFDDCAPVDKVVLERHHVIKGKTLDVKKAVPRGSSSEQSSSSFNQQQPYRYTPYGPSSQYSGYNAGGGYRHRVVPPAYGSPAGGYPRGASSAANPRYGAGRDMGSYRQSYYQDPSQQRQAAEAQWSSYTQGGSQQNFGDYSTAAAAAGYGGEMMAHQQGGFNDASNYANASQSTGGSDYWGAAQPQSSGARSYSSQSNQMDAYQSNPTDYSAGYSTGAVSYSQYPANPEAGGRPEMPQQYATHPSASAGYSSAGYAQQQDGSGYYREDTSGGYAQPSSAGTSQQYGGYGGAPTADESGAPQTGYASGPHDGYSRSSYQGAPRGAMPADPSASGQQYSTYGTYATSVAGTR